MTDSNILELLILDGIETGSWDKKTFMSLSDEEKQYVSNKTQERMSQEMKNHLALKEIFKFNPFTGTHMDEKSYERFMADKLASDLEKQAPRDRIPE